MAFLGPKNDKTIFPHVCDKLLKGLEPLNPPQPPKKTYFLKMLIILLKKVIDILTQKNHLKIDLWMFSMAKKPPVSNRVNFNFRGFQTLLAHFLVVYRCQLHSLGI